MTRSLRLSALARVSLVLLVACSSSPVGPDTSAPPPPRVEPPVGPTAGDAGASPGAQPASGATTATSASAATEEPVPPAWVEPPRREGAPGSTRGTISCGTVRCTTPGEVCKLDERANAWICEPAPAASARTPVGELPPPSHHECDDGTDCPQGQTCCSLWQGMSGLHAACVPRPLVSQVCRAELCLEGGARCPPGRSCVDGACDAPDGPASCAGGRRCPSSAPFCVKAAGSPGGYACAAQGSAAFLAASSGDRYTCTRQSDCSAGETCAYVFGEVEHEVATVCTDYQFGYMGSLLCETDRPGFCGSDQECLATMACTASPEAPPWVGVWGAK